jgi:hypothetical protein
MSLFGQAIGTRPATADHNDSDQRLALMGLSTLSSREKREEGV